MTIGVAFWVLMLLWVVLGMWWNWPADQGPRGFAPLGVTLLLFILLLLLGWGIFGAPLKGP